MRLARARGIVCVVTDRTRLLSEGPLDAQLRAIVAQAAAAASAGVDLFQIRERDLTDGRLYALVQDVVATIAGSATRVIVNDRVDVALAAGAHGVQLPALGLPSLEVRSLVPASWLVGQSIHGADTPEGDVDYAVFGTVYPTASKGTGHQWAGLDALAAASRRSAAPVLAIGGINDETVTTVANVSAGIAAIGWMATTDARRMARAVRVVREAFDTITPVI